MAIYTYDNGAAPFSIAAHSGSIILVTAPANSSIVSVGAWLDKYANCKTTWISSQKIGSNGANATIVVYNSSANPVDIYGNVTLEASARPQSNPTFVANPAPAA